jgi:hypothetical protein
VDVSGAFILTALVTVYIGYEVGKGELEVGTGVFLLILAILGIIVVAGLVIPKSAGEPMQDAFAAVLKNYGAPGAAGLVIGGGVGLYLGNKEKVAGR